MPGPTQKVSLLLNGGVDELSLDELAGPAASQGTSPTLRRSHNTRLGIRRGTCVRAPEVVARGTVTGAEIHAVIPSASGRNSLALCRPGGNQILDQNGAPADADPDNGAGALQRQIDNTSTISPASAVFLPAQIVDSGAGPGEPGSTATSSALNTASGDTPELIYHAYMIADGLYSADVVMYVTTKDGAMVATPRRVLTGLACYTLTGLYVTAHGTHGVRLWIGMESGGLPAGVAVYEVTAPSSNAFAVNFDTFPTANGAMFSVTSGLLFDQDGTADATKEVFAYMAASGVSGELVIMRIPVNTYIPGIAPALGIANVETASIAIHDYVPGSSYLIGVVSAAPDAAVPGYTKLHGHIVTESSMTVSAAGDTQITDGTVLSVACQWVASEDKLLLIHSTQETDWIYSRQYSIGPGDGVLTGGGGQYLPWMVLHSQGAQVRFSATEAYPVFEFRRYYGHASSILDPDYVPDPDVQLWMWRSYVTAPAAVARYGVVRGAAAAADDSMVYGNRPLFTGDRLYCHYLKASNGEYRSARWVALSFPQEQPAVVYDRDGVAIVAGALPFQWDGSMPTELGGPLYMPHLIVTADVTGTPWDAGSYILAAIYSWTDASGQAHRSAVGQVSFESAGATRPVIVVAAPTATMRNGHNDIDVACSLYTSSATDTTLRLSTAEGTRSLVGWTFEPSDPATEGSAVLYSSGELGSEQQPQPPCPMWDTVIIGDRLWGIDAEYRSRIVHSKRRVSGGGYECHPAYELLLPSGAGDAMAILEYQGGTLVLAENGIFGISGDGPDNLVGNPSGGAFSRPQKLADVGTTDRRSVLSTPKGVVFQRGEDILLFAGGPPVVISTLEVSSDDLAAGCRAAVHLPDANEVAFFYESGQKVWNYELNRWTTWAAAAGELVQQLPYDRNRVLMVNGGTTLRTMEADQESTTLLMDWETDWLILTGDFQDHVLTQAVVYSARSSADHSMEIRVATNYTDTASTTRTFATAALDNADGRYTLKVQPQDRGTRGVKIAVLETSLGTIPVCLSLYFTVESNFHDAALPQGAFL